MDNVVKDWSCMTWLGTRKHINNKIRGSHSAWRIQNNESWGIVHQERLSQREVGFRDKIAPGYFQVGDLYRVCQTDWPEYCVGALLENCYISYFYCAWQIMYYAYVAIFNKVDRWPLRGVWSTYLNSLKGWVCFSTYLS